MQLRYLGFSQVGNARAYRFGVISQTADDREFVVTADLSLFRKYGVAIQEGPSLCAKKLTADLEGPGGGAHELTMTDLGAFTAARTVVEERKLQSRKRVPRRARYPLTNAQSPWHSLQGQEQHVAFRGFRQYSFSLISICQNAPHAPGVYGLSNADEWIFVSSGEDVQAALLNHLNEADTAVSSRVPTGFMFESCDAEACLARQQCLVSELKPTCNAG